MVRVESTPPGAQVHWDFTYKGETPVEFEEEWLGKHRLTLDHPDHNQYVETVDLKAPWYLIFPLDFFAEFKPFRTQNTYEFHIELTQTAGPNQEAEPDESEEQEKP